MQNDKENDLFPKNLFSLLSGKSFLEKIRALLQFKEIIESLSSHSQKILEIGCGHGWLPIYFSRVYREVHTVDIHDMKE